MAQHRSVPRNEPGDRSSSSHEEGGGRLWKWVFFSGLLHVILIVVALFALPYVPSSRARSYPVYTVDLVGGDKIGGTAFGPVVNPAPARKKKIKKRKVKPPPPKAVKKLKKKKRKQKKVVKPVKKKVKVALAKPKKSQRKQLKKKPKTNKGLSSQVREKLIQAALGRVEQRAKAEQKQKTESESSTQPGESEGAAALGKGGKGGGIVKGVEFLIYRNRMLYLIRESWTWVGKRSDLEVTVRFGIEGGGDIFGLKILRSSGDPSYDDSVFRAVKKASPLPPPPEGYRKDFRDVELTFRPKDLSG
ncbi:MAG: energy transducer TonB [Candidatus Binatia bacterium]